MASRDASALEWPGRLESTSRARVETLWRAICSWQQRNTRNPIGLNWVFLTSTYTRKKTMAASDSIRFPIANYIFIRWIHSIIHSRCTRSWSYTKFSCLMLPLPHTDTSQVAQRQGQTVCWNRKKVSRNINYNRVRMTVNIKQWLLPAWTERVIDFDGDYCRFMAVMIQMPARRLETNRKVLDYYSQRPTYCCLQECWRTAFAITASRTSTSSSRSWSGRQHEKVLQLQGIPCFACWYLSALPCLLLPSCSTESLIN